MSKTRFQALLLTIAAAFACGNSAWAHVAKPPGRSQAASDSVSAATHRPAPGKRIAITIDDLPMAHAGDNSLEQMRRVNSALLQALTAQGVRAVGFVNEDKLLVKGELEPRLKLLDDWLLAGQELGNHGFNHPSFNELSLAQYQKAVLQGEVLTRWITQARQQPLRYWRHPYTQTGKNDGERLAFEAFLGENGYQVAPFTVEHDDYVFACVYERVPEHERARVVDAYLQHLQLALDSYERMSQELFDRQIPQILLIHANALNAESLAQTLLALKTRGYDFISLEQALQEPAYRSAEKASGRFGPSWLARWARAAGKRLSLYGQPDPTGWVAQQYQARCSQ